MELIGAGDKSVDFMKLLEDGFENNKERASLGRDRHENPIIIATSLPWV